MVPVSLSVCVFCEDDSKKVVYGVGRNFHPRESQFQAVMDHELHLLLLLVIHKMTSNFDHLTLKFYCTFGVSVSLPGLL